MCPQTYMSKSVSKDNVMKIDFDTLNDHFPETKNFTHNGQSQCGITLKSPVYAPTT